MNLPIEVDTTPTAQLFMPMVCRSWLGVRRDLVQKFGKFDRACILTNLTVLAVDSVFRSLLRPTASQSIDPAPSRIPNQLLV